MVNGCKVRVLVVDDHPIVRDGLENVLRDSGKIDVVGVFATGEEVLSHAQKHAVDVVLADIRMAPMNGLELLRRLRIIAPEVRVLMFSSYEREEEVYQSFIDGASGYLNKSISSKELIGAITLAASGARVFSKRDVEICEERMRKKGLTARELQVLELLAKGLTNKEIGEILCISHLTARNLIKRLYSKLEASDRTEATRIAIERGLVILE